MADSHFTISPSAAKRESSLGVGTAVHRPASNAALSRNTTQRAAQGASGIDPGARPCSPRHVVCASLLCLREEVDRLTQLAKDSGRRLWEACAQLEERKRRSIKLQLVLNTARDASKGGRAFGGAGTSAL